MAKKRILAYVSLPTVLWLDREISKGCFASYSHALNFGLKILKKQHKCTIKFKAPNSAKTEETQENVSL